jgi:hypothetical protein
MLAFLLCGGPSCLVAWTVAEQWGLIMSAVLTVDTRRQWTESTASRTCSADMLRSLFSMYSLLLLLHKAELSDSHITWFDLPIRYSLCTIPVCLYVCFLCHAPVQLLFASTQVGAEAQLGSGLKPWISGSQVICCDSSLLCVCLCLSKASCRPSNGPSELNAPALLGRTCCRHPPVCPVKPGYAKIAKPFFLLFWQRVELLHLLSVQSCCPWAGCAC